MRNRFSGKSLSLTLVACLAFTAFGSGIVAAQETGDLEAVHTRANRGDKAALTQLLKLAETGNAEAESRVGDIYSRKGDTANALKWTRRAVEHGNLEAHNMLGFWYDYGKGGVQQDKAQARKLYLVAARQGHAVAQLNLCIIDDLGIPPASKGNAVSIEPSGEPSVEPIQATKEVITEATQWCRKAADQASGEAQWRLGLLYAKGGGGMQPSYEEAYFWLTVQKSSNALRLRDEIATHLTAPVRDGLVKRAAAWKPANNKLGPKRVNIVRPAPRR